MLQDVHSNIVQQKLARKYPLMIEGAGGDDAAQPLFGIRDLKFMKEKVQSIAFKAVVAPENSLSQLR